MVAEPRARFAVCLAAYNGAQFVTAQINSILEQTGVDLQLFVSVDQSADGTETRLLQWARTEPRLTLLPLGHRFGAAAPNFYRLLRDVDLTGFDYLSFADQDDLWCREKLWRACQLLTEQKAAGYSSNFAAFWPSGKEAQVNKAWPQKKWDFLFESAGPGCTYVLRRDLAFALQDLVRDANDQLLRIDYHDWLTYALARTHHHRWVIDSWSSMKYRQHANNQIGVNAGWKSFRLRAGKVLSGYGFAQSLLIAGLVGASSLPVIDRGLRRGRLGYLWLALQARHCRRKRLDQVWFFVSCVLLAVFKPAAGGGA
jgi:rhamnosyltransferase